jgi:hypothetical protein
MSLGIFSFDLQALINSLTNMINTIQTDVAPANENTSLDRTTEVLQNTTVTDGKIDEAQMATALENVITTVMLSAENAKKEPVDTKTTVSNSTVVAPKPLIKPMPVTLDDKTKTEIEELIKSLQTSVIHNYQSTDIIDESVSLNNIVNFKSKNIFDDSDDKKDNVQEQKKREEIKLQLLQDELKKARMKNNSEV